MNGMDGQNKPTEENNMRQNRILNYIGAAGLLLAVCACSKEDLNTTSDGEKGGAVVALPEGTFVVDYSVSDGETSRAGEEGRLNTSISSMLYLLYDSEGMLVKERVIPDITDETTWPLTRDKMTWEQREALKDTLNVEMTYTAVFLANTDAELFKDTSGKAEQVFFYKTVMTGTDGTSETRYDNLKDVYLKLPSVPFNDKNMFYISKHTLSAKNADGTTVEYDRDTPYNCPVTLKRLVSRMDITKAEVTDEMIKEGLKEFYYQGETAEENKILQAVETALEKFADEACPKGKGDLWTSNLNNLKGKLKGKGTNEKTVYSEVFESCLSQLVNKCKGNSLYQSHVASWEENKDVSFTYTNQANIYNIINSLQAEHRDDISSNPNYSVLDDGRIVAIVFSNSAKSVSVASDDFNQLSAFKVGEVNYTLDTSWKVVMGPNEKNSLSCNPVAKIASTGTRKTMNAKVTVYMNSLFGSLDEFLSSGFSYDEIGVTKEALKNAINDVLTPDSYGSWNELKLTLQLPSLEEGNLELKASLTKQTNP